MGVMTPFRRLAARRRRRAALAILGGAAGAHGPDAKLTVWSGRRGAVGAVTMTRGSVQVHVVDGGYRVEWFGRCGHPVASRHETVADDAVLRRRVGEWTNRGFVHQRGPDAGPHHFLI